MPNWCFNSASITHPTDSKLIDKVSEAVENKKLFDTFHPLPDPLKDTLYPAMPRTPEEHLASAYLKAEYGADNWHDWQVKNWGTKWEASDVCLLNKTPTKVDAEFDTAWTPPLEFYQHLEATTEANVVAYYWEPGCDYLGRYANGTNQDFEASIYLNHLDATGRDPIEITSVIKFDQYFTDREEWEKQELLEEGMWMESEVVFGEENEEES